MHGARRVGVRSQALAWHANGPLGTLGTCGPFRRAYGRPGPRGSVATIRVIASSAMTVRMLASCGDMITSLSVNVGCVADVGGGVHLTVNDDGSHRIVLCVGVGDHGGVVGGNVGVNVCPLLRVGLAVLSGE